MLFVQALEKVQAKPVEHLQAKRKIKLAVRESNTDSVDLSDASSNVLQLNQQSSIHLDAMMTLETILLQQSLFYLSGLPIPIYSLQALDLSSDDWDIELQKPPKVTPSYTNTHLGGYSNSVRHQPTEIIHYAFSITLLSSDHQQFSFDISMRAARFTQEKNGWPTPTMNKIKLAPVQSMYDSAFLQSIEKQFTFFFDQDGDSNQATPIIEKMEEVPTLELLRNNTFFQGMRVWRLHKERLDIALIGDPCLGAIHTATYSI